MGEKRTQFGFPQINQSDSDPERMSQDSKV